jgi:hypothetical protein
MKIKLLLFLHWLMMLFCVAPIAIWSVYCFLFIWSKNISFTDGALIVGGLFLFSVVGVVLTTITRIFLDIATKKAKHV